MHTPRHTLLALAAVVAAAACHPFRRTPPPTVVAVMRSAPGTGHGMLTLERVTSGVRITGALTGLPPGVHGIHLHEVGRCDPPDFATAGPHFNPGGRRHGLENPQGPHAGDLPNIPVNAAGQVIVDLAATSVTLDAAAASGVFDADGTAVVIHAAADDQRTDPAGNSGSRIACGVVERR